MQVLPIINNQSFKSLYRHETAIFSKEQELVAKDITEKCSNPDDKYNNRSLIELLENDYEMDLCIDSHSDKKSVSLYLAQKAYVKDNENLKTLRPVGKYDYSTGDRFETGEVIEELDRMTFSKSSNLVNSIATVLFVLGAIAIPVISIATLIKERKIDKVENVIKQTTDTIKELPKDTLNIINKIK